MIKGFNPRVEFRCPFCGGNASTGFVDGWPAASHTYPYCKEFETKGVDEYQHAVLVELQKGTVN